MYCIISEKLITKNLKIMMTMLSGTLMSFLANLMLIGFYFAEAIILAITFNKMAPAITEKFDLVLPIEHVSIWFVWGIFIIIHFVGRLINMLIPKLVNIENNQNAN